MLSQILKFLCIILAPKKFQNDAQKVLDFVAFWIFGLGKKIQVESIDRYSLIIFLGFFGFSTTFLHMSL
jgi:hypothetical protein